jgi:hypothetical protein
MFKRLLLCTVVSSLVVSVSAFAVPNKAYKGEVDSIMPQATPMLQPYVGLNYVYYHSNYKSSATETVGSTTRTFNPGSTSPNNFSGASLDAGFKYGQYAGMEFGYYQTASKSRTSNNGTSTTISEMQKAFYTDVMGYWPIHDWDIIGLVGVSVNSLGNASISYGSTVSTLRTDDAVRPRIGLGVDYHFNKNIGVRALARYSFVQSNFVNNAYTIDAGVFYTFC